ncbi:hypothetical protein SAMN05428953_118112 [Mesorhizobium muleiense]|uniref:Uncharacterized protein n=1 Tax=Mesorhizobium muleiense TaxID=1004279 RepID=A0A1G9DS12_9HYPH|nr:hypothetical protein SAMN05428953_118112 [Mesorhizobium muleiense]
MAIGLDPLSDRRPAPERSHVGLGPGFVDEHQAGGIDPNLVQNPLRAVSGRSCLTAISVFFVRQLLGLHKLPHRAVIDLQAALAEFGHKPAQGGVLLSAALDKPVAPRPRYRSGL